MASVVAGCDISEGVSSLPGVGPINLRSLFEDTIPNMLLHADVSDNHLCIAELKADEDWARFIAVAKNCHEQNVEITNTPRGLILRAIRPIKAYEELFVWIGSDLLSRLEFPFLKPSNIRGNQAYHCHKCGSIFENPNPLKVHLSFLCKNLEINSLRESSVKNNWSDKLHQLFPLDVIKNDKAKVSIICSKTIPFNRQMSFVEPIYHNISFLNSEKDSMGTSMNTDDVAHDMTLKHPILHQTPRDLSSVSSNWTSTNCSRTTQGHICTFCGKIYSRKYGLKIHVRTHTGYKPLKCKYCFRPFSDPSNLNKHVRLHSESDAPYRCLKCGKVLVRRRDLERHMKSRHPETPSCESRKQHNALIKEIKESLHSDSKSM